MTVMPDPPPQVEVGAAGFGSTASWIIPVVRRPDVAGRVDGHVGEHLDGAALEHVDDVARSSCPRGWPFVSTPGHQHDATTEAKLPIHTSSLPSMFNPHGMSMRLPPVKPFGASWVPSGRIMWITPVDFGYHQHGCPHDFETAS